MAAGEEAVAVSLIVILKVLSKEITASVDTSLSKLQKMVTDREAWRAVVHGSQTAGHT